MMDLQKFETLKIEQNGDGITWLYLNRPEKRNAMNPTLHLEMVEALGDLAFDDETKVLVLTGAGSAFCAGMDIKEFFRDLQDSPREFARIGKASQALCSGVGAEICGPLIPLAGADNIRCDTNGAELLEDERVVSGAEPRLRRSTVSSAPKRSS